MEDKKKKKKLNESPMRVTEFGLFSDVTVLLTSSFELINNFSL